MRRWNVKKIMGLLACLVIFAGCATTPTTTTTSAAKAGFLGPYEEKLAPGPEGGVRWRWVKPGVDFSKYNKVMLESVVFFFADDSQYHGIDPQELKEIADAANLQLVRALKDKYPLVADPGPDVLRIRVAITELEQSRPGLSAVTSVVPVGIGISVLKKGATGSWTGSGATGAEMMVLDSTTDEVLAVAKDKRSAGFTERFSKWGSAEEAFAFWAERIRLFLDQAHSAKRQ
uniref:DUF3313 domain-containing protein n=1 Tax=Desulfacinum infernum TaxID=35837 RepID=A0A831ZXY0_9BACT